MYRGFAAYKNWDFEVMNYTNAEYGELGICLNVGYLSDSGGILLLSRETKIQRNTLALLWRTLVIFFHNKVQHLSSKCPRPPSVALRRSAPCRGEDRRRERVQAAEARGRNPPRAEDPRGRPLLQDAAHPHGDHDGHRHAAAGGGRTPPTPQLSLRSPGVISTAAHPLLLAGCPHRPEGPSHRHLQVPGRRGAKRQHHGQRGASCSPAHR